MPFKSHIVLILLLAALHVLPVRAAQSVPTQERTLGVSQQGRPITAVRFGDGPRKLVVVGDTHGGPEANTYELTSQLIAHFRDAPGEVPPSVSLYLIPTLNPDGLALGSRFAASGVDLNRNMDTNLDDCTENDWRTRVEGAYGVISDTGGPYPESEAESRLIRDFLLDASGAIFLHSNAGLVFPAFCEHQPSIQMGQIYAQAAGYTYSRYWPKYNITGGMHDWAGSLGIAAITPELVTGDQPEFAQNLAGLQAVLANAGDLLLRPQDRQENGVQVPALIWRYWKAHGGAARFGPPLAPATPDGPLTRQVFERAVLELHPDQAGTPQLVQPLPLGRERLTGLNASARVTVPGACANLPAPCREFAETGHTLREAFLGYWERADGELLFGLPVSEEFETIAADGKRRAVQYFEHAAFAYYPEDGSVRLEPLGWAFLTRQKLFATPGGGRIR